MRQSLVLLVLALSVLPPWSARADEAMLLQPVPPPPVAAPAPQHSLEPATPTEARPPATAAGTQLTDSDPAPTGTRHFGIMYGAGPAVLALDLEIGNFYGFVSAPLALDLFVHDDLALGALGLGATFRIPRDPRFSFDVWAFGIPGKNTALGGSNPQVMLTFGVGAGFHFTSQRGFTFGLKLPLFGSTVSLDSYSFTDPGQRALTFYMNSLLTLPVASFGYRF